MGGLYLALITHECAQVGGLVPGRCSGIDDNALRTRWRGEHDGGKTRCLILEDETSIRILRDICQLRLRGKQQKVLDVRVPCEVPEKRGWGKLSSIKEKTSIDKDESGTHIPSRGSPRLYPLFWNVFMASSKVHFKVLIRAYRGIRAVDYRGEKKKKFSSSFGIEEIGLPTTYPLARHLLVPFRHRSWHPA